MGATTASRYRLGIRSVLIALVAMRPSPVANARVAATCMGRTATIVSSDAVIEGTAADDVIVARGFVDRILARAGNDVVCGGRRVDEVRGGAGRDRLSPGRDGYWFRTFGDDGRDLLSTGARGPDRAWLFGGSGRDRLVGTDPGNAYLDGGPGADVLDGSDGYQWVTFSAADGVTADLASGYSSGQGRDRLVEIESVVGTPRDDRLTGTGWYNRIDGGDGADIIAAGGRADLINGGPGDDVISAGRGLDELRGGPGADQLSGGADYDRFHPGHDDDSIDGGSGDDLIYEMEPRGAQVRMGDEDIDGGEGVDLVFFSALSGGARSDEPVSVDLAAGTASVAGEHTVREVEDVTLLHTGPVRLVGDGEANDLYVAGDLSAVVEGGPGNDTIAGGAGPEDRFDGGDGVDTISYAGYGGVTVDLAAGVATGRVGVDQLVRFEDISARCLGDGGTYVLLGDDGPNRIEAGCRNDHLDGRAGDDFLTAGGGDDALDGGDGTDSLDGGEGVDECVNGEAVVNCEGGPRR